MKHFRTGLGLLGLAMIFGSCGVKQPSPNTPIQAKSKAAEAGRMTIPFHSGWRFMKGPQPATAAQMDFDDSGWQPVRLPHDWAIAGPFNPEEHGYAGKLPWKGVGWYRKVFSMPASEKGSRVYLDFDGVMAFPEVYINGQLAGQWDYGYMSFRVDATPYIRFGRENVVAVKADTRNQGTRWYPGAGIYRKVTMVVCRPVHLGHWATYVTTPEVTDQRATVVIRTAVENHLDADTPASVRFVLTDPAGHIVAEAGQDLNLPAGESKDMQQSITLSHPIRWDIAAPNLYTLGVSVQAGDTLLDAETTSFGIRTFSFTADDGFHLNGRRVPLYGVNLHHDHGPLGAAFYPRAMERQLEIMKDMGVNSIRTSHNPPAPELLALCDRMGLVVWNEAFDKWDDKAGRINGQPPLEEYGHRQIRNFVRRDRNHPCIVVWSIGNEISNQPHDREGKSPERVAMMRDFVLKYDNTRPVGIGCHIPQTANEPILDSLDLTGWNYLRRYSIFRERYPDKPIIYSESASALSTRGFYALPLPTVKTDYADRKVNSYDFNAAAWSDIPDVEFALMEQDRFVAGEMVWTGFDYLGEPTPFDQEARSSYFGIVDLCGIPKDRFYLYRSYWRPEETTVHILPHWNWPQRVGQPVPVFVYTNGDSAELFLNGQSLGRRIKGQRPAKPADLADGKAVAASSEEYQKANTAAHAFDGQSETRWCAASGETGQWLQADLGERLPIRCIALEFEREEKYYGYEIHISDEAADWTLLVAKSSSDQPRWGGPREIFHSTEAAARYVRIVFTELRDDCWASVRRFGIYSERFESDYYDPTYDYRLRWNEVVYEPGELKAVAYKNGQVIGQAVMRTAGAPAQIRLTPDRAALSASGEDLSYILVEALDKNGTLCPLADDLVRFEIEGPGEIAGVGNGDPMSFEPFQADSRKLFYGKAMLIVRTKEGKTGTIRVTATADGLKDGRAEMKTR